jgi:hypothetical protein
MVAPSGGPLQTVNRFHSVRIFLTLIAVALIVALSAALLAPLFVDWSLHRAQIEAELSEILGARVVVSGTIDIGFLPTPYVQLNKVKIDQAGGDGAPVFACENLRLEAALASLPSGRARFTLARLDHPVLTLSRSAGGSLRLPLWRVVARPDRIALDRVVVTGGELRVVSASAPVEIVGLDLDASAGSLVGPFRGSGRASRAGGAPANFRFASGALANSALPLKLEVDPTDGLPNGVFDGAVTIAPHGADGETDLAYAGSVVVSGTMAMSDAEPASPWIVSGALHADLGGASIDDLVARFGPDERALEASGAARLELGSPAGLSIDLNAKELNIDALLRENGEDAVAPARALAAAERILAPLNAGGGSPMAVRLAFTTPTVIVGAQTLSDVVLNARASAGQPIGGELSLGLPGQSNLRLAGALELGSAAQFRGRLEAQLGDFSQLRAWASEGEPELAERLAAFETALPYRNAAASGDVEISEVGFSARNLQLVVDRTTLTGAMAFTLPLGAERGRLFTDLRSDALDVDALPNLSASAGFIGDIDLSLALEAARLRVARVGEAAIDGGSLSVKMTKTGGELSLDRLSVAGLGGASIEVRGASGPQSRWLTVQLNADKLRDVAAMVGRIAPGPLSRLLVQRADVLSPAKATFEARAAGQGLAGGFGFDSLKAQGSAGQSQFTLKAGRSSENAGGLAATFTLDSPDGAALLRQIGLKPSSVSGGPARFEASANGRWDKGFDISATASLADANFTWRGRIKPEPAMTDDAVLFGVATVKSDDIMPLLATLGLGGPASAPPAPVDLSADLVLRGQEVRVPRLAGTVAGSKLSGQLDWRPPPEPTSVSSIEADVALARSIAGEAPLATATQIDGDLALDHASLSALLSLPLGALQPAKPGKWSDAKFAAPLVEPPPLEIRLKIGALELAEGLQARGAAARLRMEGGRFDFNDLTMDVAGGRASGRVTVRRDGALATLSGQASLDSTVMDRAGLRGRFGAALAFASTGQSPGALVAGLVGEGQVQTSGLAIPRLDPEALQRVLAKAQTPDALIDETNVTHALGLEFDRQAMSLPDGTAPAVINAGVVHIGPLDMSTKGGDASTSADFDLRSQELTIRTAFSQADGGKFWSGPSPVVTVAVTGSLNAPSRQIDASGFVAGLAAQAIAREGDRIATLEADIRERAYFNRRMKAELFMRQRDAELAAFAADQERIKSEAERKRVEDELARASDAKQKLTPTGAAPTNSAGVASPPVVPPGPKADQIDRAGNGLY